MADRPQHFELGETLVMVPAAAQLTGVWLRSSGNERKPHFVEVLIEVGGRWVPLIREGIADAGGLISHIIERGGIERRVRESGYSDPQKPDPLLDGLKPRE